MSKIFNKPKRAVGKVFLHCSDSDISSHDNIQTIKKWHVEKGFVEIGYHFFITKDGKIHKGRCVERVPASQIGHNFGSLSVCLSGRKDFTDLQSESLKNLCKKIDAKYFGNITFHGHCEVSQKACPVFNYIKVLGLQNGKLQPNKHNVWGVFFADVWKIIDNLL